MAVAGAKPKTDRSQVRHKVPAVHEWVEVPNVPFRKAPKLPRRDREDGAGFSVMAVGVGNSPTWPESTVRWWAAISTMPHAKLWGKAEWQFAFDSAEIHARTTEAWRGYSGAEIRAREKLMGTLADYRRDLRIRYVEPVDPKAVPAGVTKLSDYRDL